MASVYVIIKGTHPSQYEPVGVAGSLDLAKKAASKWVDSFNVENDGFNSQLKDASNKGARVADYEYKKPLTLKGPDGDYWDNDMDFVTFKKMEIITE